MEHGIWSLFALVAATAFMFRSLRMDGRGWNLRRQRSRHAGAEQAETASKLLEQQGDILALEARVAELEGRLDFAERMLAAGRELSPAGRFDR